METEIKWDELLAVATSSLRQSTRSVKDGDEARFGARILRTDSWDQFYEMVRTKKSSYAVPLYVLIPPGVMKLLFYTLKDTDLIKSTASASDVLAEVIVDYCRLLNEGRQQNENNGQINSSSSDGVSEESVVEQVLPDSDRRDSRSEEVGPDGSGISGS
jgi:hypothetical protein